MERGRQPILERSKMVIWLAVYPSILLIISLADDCKKVSAAAGAGRNADDRADRGQYLRASRWDHRTARLRYDWTERP